MINLSKILFFSTLLLLIGCNTTMEPIQQSTEFTYQEKDIQFFQDGYSNGEFTVSKPPRTGGLVSFGTVAEQFLYEIGDPSRYLLPDVICDFSEVTITEMGNDIVQVKNAKGLPPSNKYKISATYMNGYNVIGKLVIGGLKAEKKGKIIAEAILLYLQSNCCKKF